MTDSNLICDHCQLPIPQKDLVVDRIEERNRHFCCQGCRGAYRIITGAGMGDFYRRRDWKEAGLPMGAFDSPYDDAWLEKFVTSSDGTSELTLLVEGIRCASCVWLLERILADIPGVLQGRINYGTHRARILFDPSFTAPREIVAALARIGYSPRPYTAGHVQQAAEAERRQLMIRFGTAFFLSMQLMGYSLALYAGFFQGMDEETRMLIQAFAAAVTTPVVFYAGWPFFSRAWRSLRNRAPGMDLLIALGVLSAYGYSLFALVRGGEVYFDTAAMIVTLVLAGRLFENGARRKASADVDRLLQLAPERARRLENGEPAEVASAELRVGDRIRVLPGERFPTDGSIAAGEAEVDESAATGEPLPILKHSGAAVLSGTLNLSTAVTVRVDRPAADSFAARVAVVVEEAQSRKAPVQRLSDRVAALFVPAVVAVAAATWGYWKWQGLEGSDALLNAVAVLVVACPCALGLATPTAVLVASGRAARRGILFRGGDVLEQCARIRSAAFDKTGTLTAGRPQVSAILAEDGDEDGLLQLAAEAESASNHPLARGVLEEAQRRGLSFGCPEGVFSRPGKGVELFHGGNHLRVGSRSFLQEAGIAPPASRQGKHLTEVHVALGEVYRGCILLDDPLRSEAHEAVRHLRSLGMRTALLTGDRQETAGRIAAALGIGEVHSGLTPEGKARWVERLQAEGEPVLMVGDGINDAPALSAAAVGCSMAGGTDIALDTSDLVLTRPDLDRLVEAVELARRTLRIIRQNLLWAFAYNLAAIPLAAAGKLVPIHAAAAMALSSICVIGNSLRLAAEQEEKDTCPRSEEASSASSRWAAAK